MYAVMYMCVHVINKQNEIHLQHQWIQYGLCVHICLVVYPNSQHNIQDTLEILSISAGTLVRTNRIRDIHTFPLLVL